MNQIAAIRPTARPSGGALKRMERHPLSVACGDMSESDFDALVEDIKKNGQKQVVLTLDGMVFDGWHRYRACDSAGVKCVTAKYEGKDPRADVLSLNLHRRHSSASQRAAIVVAVMDWRPQGAGGHTAKPAPGAGLASEAEMAKAAEVSERTIRQAKVAHEAGLGPDVRDGKMSAKAAAAKATGKTPSRKAPADAPEKPAEETVPLKKYQALSEKYDELVEALEDYASISNGDAAKDMKVLHEKVRLAERRRDELMNECKERGKQIEIYKRELKKLGWKGFAK